MDKHKQFPGPRKQTGMDRVVEKTSWQRYRKPVVWGGIALLALIIFWYFKPAGGRALKVQNDRIVVSTVSSGSSPCTWKTAHK
jgi:hypothetical protein